MSTRQAQKAATARKIFEAAVALFAEQGYAATTIEQITAAAGVAKGTFFVHFASKEAVLGHIGAIQMIRLRAALAEQPTFATRSFAEQALTIFLMLAEGIINQPDQVRILAIETLRHLLLDPAASHIDDLNGLLTELAVEAQRRGELRSDHDPALIAAALSTNYFSAVIVWLQRQCADDLRELLRFYNDMAMNGLLV